MCWKYNRLTCKRFYQSDFGEYTECFDISKYTHLMLWRIYKQITVCVAFGMERHHRHYESLWSGVNSLASSDRWSGVDSTVSRKYCRYINEPLAWC